MHPANAAGLFSAAHIDAVCLANNHVLDWGYTGLDETLRTLRAVESGTGDAAGPGGEAAPDAGGGGGGKPHRLQCAGAGADREEAWAPACLPLPSAAAWDEAHSVGGGSGGGGGGGSVLVFSVGMESSGVPREWAAAEGGRRLSSPAAGVALLPDLTEASAQRLAAHITHYRSSRQSCGSGSSSGGGTNSSTGTAAGAAAAATTARDLVVLSVHWGGNWVPAVPPAHRAFARRLIDLGAVDVVYGHSSHHPLPVEVYRGKVGGWG